MKIEENDKQYKNKNKIHKMSHFFIAPNASILCYDIFKEEPAKETKSTEELGAGPILHSTYYIYCTKKYKKKNDIY